MAAAASGDLRRWSARGLFDWYQQWSAANRRLTSSVESALLTLACVAPGETAGDLLSEAVYSAVSLVSMAHDLLYLNFVRQRLAEARGALVPSEPLPPRWWSAVAKWLQLLASVELLAEMAAQKYYGRSGKWHAVFTVEALKALLRLVLLQRSNGAVLVHQSLPERHSLELKGRALDASGSSALRPDGRQRATLFDLVQASMGARVEYAPTPASGRRLLAELLAIVRPLIYVLLLLRFGRRSWRPWLVSLALDALSVQAMRPLTALNEVEQTEMGQRTWNWLFYVLRAPPVRRLKSLQLPHALRRDGPFGFVTRLVDDYIYDYLEYYFYVN